MKNIIKTLGLLSIFAVIPASFAATSRVSMISKASPRLPSIAGYIMANSAAKGTLNTVVNATSYLADPDCISNYTDCIKGNDACGSNFEDCTNATLLHAKMPACLSVLAQCSAAGRTSLFGTADLNAIATAATTNANGEITAYTYPLAGSALGQMITAAQIDNQLSADKCVKNYTSCLRKDNVCGYDFELCTDDKEFKKQALECASTLARCQSDGKTELFGSVAAANGLTPAAGSRLAELITEGAALAVNNAVATCNKVTDQCILNACTKNPNKCIEGRPEILIRIADATNGGKAVTTQDLMEITKITAKREISNYIRQECQQTIGSNKYCYMTVKGKPVTKESVLTNPDNVSEVFEDMYNGEFGRFAALKDKITQIADNFDAKVQDKCIDTISSCAMRSCGGGIGSVCYSQSRDENGSVDISKTTKSYNEVKSACRAIVDVDANCQYSAVLSQGSLYAGYMDDTNSVFTTLYPQKVSATTPDPIGVIATLNATLAQSYNDAAIENMRKQCQAVALSCVNSVCGKDYENCYRNRNDITINGSYTEGDAKFNNSMNKVGGVLDYNIVIGLCLNDVKNSPVCNEHLKIALSELTDDTQSWGSNKTVRSAWKDANSTNASALTDDDIDSIVVACRPADNNPKVNTVCPTSLTEEPDDNGQCIGLVDENGCVYDTPVTKRLADYKLDNAGTSLFQELLADVEWKVQQTYNAKLTKEQNVCRAQNNGGIMGAAENGSTFMWAKLRSNKIPKNYNIKGLKANQFVESNDLYGSFCRARITVTSDDKDIQSVLNKEGATAYFAVGDAFTCGSWIDDKIMAKISEKVGQRKLCEEGYGVWNTKTGECSGMSTKEKIAYAWGTVAPALAAGGIGVGLTEGGVLSKWMAKGNANNSVSSTTFKSWKDKCIDATDKAKDASDAGVKAGYVQQAYEACSKMGISIKAGCTIVNTTDSAFNEKMDQLNTACKNEPDDSDNGENGRSNKAARIVIPIATTLAGGALGAGITASVIQAKKEEIKNKAVAEWMEEIGEHIQCYLGADELGSYGDVVSFTIE